jgi:hypothetical protein
MFYIFKKSINQVILIFNATIQCALKVETMLRSETVTKCKICFRQSAERSNPESIRVGELNPWVGMKLNLEAVLRIRIRIYRIRMFLDLLDPDPDPLVRGMDPDPSITKQIVVRKTESGSIGSVCFWTSWIRIRIHKSEVWIRILLSPSK